MGLLALSPESCQLSLRQWIGEQIQGLLPGIKFFEREEYSFLALISANDGWLCISIDLLDQTIQMFLCFFHRCSIHRHSCPLKGILAREPACGDPTPLRHPWVS